MYIPTALLLLATSLLPSILAQESKQEQAPILAVPIKPLQDPTPQAAKNDEYIQTLEQEFSTHMTTHKSTMKSHLESLAEILGVELDSIAGADLEGLLSTVVLVLGDVEIDARQTYRSKGRGGTAKGRGSDEVRGTGGNAPGTTGKGGNVKGRVKKGDRHDVEEKLEIFVQAMGIVSEMKEQHLALNLWLVGIREKIRALKIESRWD